MDVITMFAVAVAKGFSRIKEFWSTRQLSKCGLLSPDPELPNISDIVLSYIVLILLSYKVLILEPLGIYVTICSSKFLGPLGTEVRILTDLTLERNADEIQKFLLRHNSFCQSNPTLLSVYVCLRPSSLEVTVIFEGA